MSPSASPSASPSVAENELTCEDGIGTFTLVNTGNVATCDWLTKNNERMEQRMKKYCGLNEIKLLCPSSCNFCTCEDDAEHAFELMTGETVDCSYITKNKNKMDIRKAKFCTDEFDGGATLNACTKSCGICE